MIELRAVIVCGGRGLVKAGETARAAIDVRSNSEGRAALEGTA
jgi:hypothetical protein